MNDEPLVIIGIETKKQAADIFTKLLEASLFKYLRIKIIGW